MVDYMPVVIAAEHLHDYTIKVTFDNGEERIVDCENGYTVKFLRN